MYEITLNSPVQNYLYVIIIKALAGGAMPLPGAVLNG